MHDCQHELVAIREAPCRKITTAMLVLGCTDHLPRAGSGVVRIDPLRFLAGCRIRRLNQALSVLSLLA